MTKIISDAEIARLAELESKATLQGWFVDTDEEYGVTWYDVLGDDCVVTGDRMTKHDAELIAESRNALPRLLDTLRRYKEALAIAMPCIESEEGWRLSVARIRQLLGDE